MKVSFYITLALLTSGHAPARSQSVTSAIPQTIVLRNALTGVPVDARLHWTNADAVTREAIGLYKVTLEPGAGGELTLSRPGYFDSQVNLDYDAARESPTQEVMLQPGVPQLHISVYDQESNEKLSSSIDLFTLGESSVVFSEAVDVSPFTIDLEYNTVHVLQVRKPGYFSFKDTIDFSNVFDGRVRTRTIKLVPLKAGNKISLNTIYFHKGEATLTAFAMLMLVELTHILAQQPGIVIEIGVYTDDVGSASYALTLSEKRARAVREYLVGKGAQPNQLLARGYGEASPVAANNPDVNRALNSRVEFKIIRLR